MTSSHTQTPLFWHESGGFSNASQSSLPKTITLHRKAATCTQSSQPGGREECKPYAPNRPEGRYQINSARGTLRCHWTPSNACWGPSHIRFWFYTISLSDGFWKQFYHAFCCSSDPDADDIACSPYCTPTRTQISAKISSLRNTPIWVCRVGTRDV